MLRRLGLPGIGTAVLRLGLFQGDLCQLGRNRSIGVDGVLDLRQQKRAHSPGLVELRVGLLLLRLERGDIRGLVLSRFDIGVQ